MKRPEFNLAPKKKRLTAPFKVLDMSNQLLRTALVSTLLLSASVRLPAAETRSAQQQIDSLRQQQAQAMAKGDFVTAARHAQELKALEANVGAVAAPALTPAPAPLVPASSSSFFAAPANAPVPAPAGSSSAFNLPASTGASFTAPPRTVASRACLCRPGPDARAVRRPRCPGGDFYPRHAPAPGPLQPAHRRALGHRGAAPGGTATRRPGNARR